MFRAKGCTQLVFIKFHKIILIISAYLLSGYSHAADISIGDQETLIHEQRQADLQKNISPNKADVRLQLPVADEDINIPSESPCFSIRSVELLGSQGLPGEKEAMRLLEQVIGQCLGANGLRTLMDKLQEFWIARGFITTRILAPAQNLSEGILRLQVVKGTVANIYFADKNISESIITWGMPADKGEVLNLRDIEQGLENLQLSSSVNAGFKLLPGEKPGESDILINYEQKRNWRASLSLNDSGSESTGKYQGGATIFWDNPLNRNDVFYISIGNDLHGNSGKESNNITLNYSIPYRYWRYDFSLNSYQYLQSVQGLNEVIDYEGKNRAFKLEVRRGLFRNNNSKSSFFIGLSAKESQNYIEGQEVGVQHRKSTKAIAGFDYMLFSSLGKLDARLSYEKGLDILGALKAPESYYSNADTLSDVYKLKIGIVKPFKLGGYSFKWRSSIAGQWTPDILTTTDRISIGSRYSVRGFDGRVTLSGDSGFYIQNDLSIKIPKTQAQFFIGLDYGAVSGPSTSGLASSQLVGAVTGINGSWKGVSYRLFVGTPIEEPRSGFTDSTTIGFDINWQY